MGIYVWVQFAPRANKLSARTLLKQKGCFLCPVSGVWCPVSGVRCLLSGVCCLVFDCSDTESISHLQHGFLSNITMLDCKP